MKTFYFSGNKFSRLLLLLAIVVFGFVAYGIYWALKFVFAQSFFLGVVLIFIGLPFILRLFFISSVGFMTALLGFLSSFGQKKYNESAQEDGVIDVKGKIVK